MSESVLERRLDRERRARAQAEALLEEKSRELFLSNEQLRAAGLVLENQSKELSAILDHADIAIILLDEHGKVHRANAAATALFSAGKPTILSLPMEDIVTIDPAPDTTDGNILQQTVQAKTPDGSETLVELSIVGVSIEGEAYTLWLCRDVSRRAAAEQERLRLEHELAQAQRLEALGVMASGIAHEINTPIQYVRDNVSFLSGAISDFQQALSIYKSVIGKLQAEKAAQTPEVSGLLGEIEDIDLEFLAEEMPDALSHTSDGLAQISKIVGAVKSFSHPGTDHKTPTEINTLLEDAFTVTSSQWKYAAELEMTLADKMPEISAYPSELNQVFMNLIVNAAHAIAEANRERGLIKAATSVSAEGVKIHITDNGSGISPENLSRVFDPFFTTKDVGKGTGQGLSFCHQIITQRHGGQISVSSEHGVSTTFEITLPLH